MFNYAAIDKTPTVAQVKAIIKYMDEHIDYNPNFMMGMKRIEPGKILVDINNAHHGKEYIVLFNDNDEISSFSTHGAWMS